MHRELLNSDDELDRLLRAVPVPSGFARRLVTLGEEWAEAAALGKPEFTDERVAEPLNDVPIPAGLHARLRSIPALDDDADHGNDLEFLAASARPDSSDAELDARLRDVSVPPGLPVRLRAIARRSFTARRLAAAAALFIVVGGTYGYVFVEYFNMRHGPIAGGGLKPDALVLNLRDEVEASGDLRFVAPATDRPMFVITPYSNTLPAALAAERNRLASIHRTLATPRTPRLDVFQATAWAMGATASYTGNVQGASLRDELPDLVTHATHLPRGVDVPLGAEGRKFLLDYGVFPRVTPTEFPISVVPLTHDTTSYELARAYVAEGQWPKPEQMRSEEFLAAVDYAFGRPSDQAARLYAAGAIAPWNPPSPADRPLPPERLSRLLQLSVQARELPGASRPATHLTVGVDVTESMQAGGRLEMIRGAAGARRSARRVRSFDACRTRRLEPGDRRRRRPRRTRTTVVGRRLALGRRQRRFVERHSHDLRDGRPSRTAAQCCAPRGDRQRRVQRIRSARTPHGRAFLADLGGPRLEARPDRRRRRARRFAVGGYGPSSRRQNVPRGHRRANPLGAHGSAHRSQPDGRLGRPPDTDAAAASRDRLPIVRPRTDGPGRPLAAARRDRFARRPNGHFAVRTANDGRPRRPRNRYGRADLA
ncbi:MAG: von Willebrand factor type A domain-containing protein [Pirellulales bacterium]